MLEEKLLYFLRNQQFVSLGTSNLEGRPHVSPKILLKYEGKYLYLVDHLDETSHKDIKENNNVAASTFDMKKVEGFHIYGKAHILKNGKEYKSLLAEWDEAQNKMMAECISDNVGGHENIKSLKFSFVVPVEIYKIRISRIDFINIGGALVIQNV